MQPSTTSLTAQLPSTVHLCLTLTDPLPHLTDPPTVRSQPHRLTNRLIDPIRSLTKTLYSPRPFFLTQLTETKNPGDSLSTPRRFSHTKNPANFYLDRRISQKKQTIPSPQPRPFLLPDNFDPKKDPGHSRSRLMPCRLPPKKKTLAPTIFRNQKDPSTQPFSRPKPLNSRSLTFRVEPPNTLGPLQNSQLSLSQTKTNRNLDL